MLSVRSISKSYNDMLVIRGVTFSIASGQRLGVVGPNGVGKSTLLRIIAGIEDSDEGAVEHARSYRVNYCAQEIPLAQQENTVAHYLSLESGDGLQGEIFDMLSRFKFPLALLERKVSDLSGGERSRVALVKTFMVEADLYVLDEPTNNLDLDGLLVLEDIIQERRGSCLIVSHDREFLDRVVDGIIELDWYTHACTYYPGNFSFYLKEHEARLQRVWDQYGQQQKEIGRIKESARERQDWASKGKKGSKKSDNDKLGRNAGRDRSGKLAGNSSSLDRRIEQLDRVEKPRELLPLKISFEVQERSGDLVIKADGLQKSFPDSRLGPVDFSLKYGERVAIIGPNGAGKTTLLRLLLGTLNSDVGTVRLGSRLQIGYLPQIPHLRSQATVLEEYLSASLLDEATGRKLLNRFGLSREDVGKKICQLSPGERSRLILAKLMSISPNFLVLDEPTNHLDLEALNQLEKALVDFPGTLLIVTHDRYLLDRLGVTATFLLTKQGAMRHITDYHEYERLLLENAL